MTAYPSTGSLPHQRGAALEEVLQWQHNVYAANRRAHVWHNGLKAEVRNGKGGAQYLTHLVKSRPDYEGVLTDLGGRHVAFDAKHTQEITYHHDRRRLHQLRDLWDIHEAGGIAFLLVSWNLERYWLCWPEPGWSMTKPYTVKLPEMSPDRGIEVPTGGSYKLPDWLSTLEEVIS